MNEGLLVQDANLMFFSKMKKLKKKKMLVVVLGNLEWKMFLVTQPGWATFKISFGLFSFGKLIKHVWKVKSNPEIISETSQTPIKTFLELFEEISFMSIAMQNMTESLKKKKNQLTTTKHCEKFSFRLEKYNKTLIVCK